MGKKGKKGKKKKGGKALPAYDLDYISKVDCKKYVILLENELAKMRKDCAFYAANKDRIMAFLETRRNVIFSETKQTSVVKTAVMDDLIENLRKFPEHYNEETVSSDKADVRKKVEGVFHDFVLRSTVEADHLEEELFFKQHTSDRDRQLKFDHFQREMTKEGEKECFEFAQVELDKRYSEKLQGALELNISQSLSGNQGFNADKMRMLISVWNIQNLPEGAKESYISEMKRMQNFFSEISKNNNEVIKMLRSALADSMIEDQKVNLNLKQTTLENMELRAVQPAAFNLRACAEASVRISQNKGNIQHEKNLEKLMFRNEVLKEQLRIVKGNLQDAKKQFIAAIRKVRQKAEYKAYLMEEIIRTKIEKESMMVKGEEPGPPMPERSRKERDRNVKLNPFSVRIENSDTLYVPALFDDYWF